MKYILLFSLVLLTHTVIAQNIIAPNKNVLGTEKLVDRHFDLDWNMVVGENKTKIGSVHLDMVKKNNHYTIITTTKLSRFPDSHWVDSSICELPTLSPVYHSSYNMQRDMVLHFGKKISGYYLNKQNDSLTHISDSITSPYFDSNLYQWLMCLLPIHEGMKAKLPLYDYNPSKNGLMYADIEEVKNGEYISPISGNHQVWIIATEDNISGATNSLIFYIDKKDRTFWKMEAQIGNRKIEQVLHEQ